MAEVSVDQRAVESRRLVIQAMLNPHSPPSLIDNWAWPDRGNRIQASQSLIRAVAFFIPIRSFMTLWNPSPLSL
jgi:hypothetical protein